MKVKKRQVILKTNRFTVNKDLVEHHDSTHREYLYIEKPSAVLLIPIFNCKVGLIDIERYLIQGISLEVPGGRIESDESPEDAAKRELFEECNLQVESVKHLSTIFPLPSVTTEKVHIFSVHITSINEVHLEKDEFIKNLTFYSINELITLLKENRIKSCVDAYAISQFIIEYLSND